MERVIVNEGTKVDLFNLFEDLQNYTASNFNRLVGLFIESYGINASTLENGQIYPSDNSLQVTASAGTFVNVAVGEAITSGLHYIGITTPTTVSLVGLGIGIHTLYMRHQYTYGNPVNVMSGFAIGLVGGSQKNSRTHDSYAFVWDTSPAVSGVILAQVNVLDGAYNHTVTADYRWTNVFKLAANAMPGWDIVRKNYPGVQTMASGIQAASYMVKSTLTPSNSFFLTTGSGINTLTGSEATSLKALSHIQNTDTYTTASGFWVGGGPGVGALVLTVADDPMMPLNLRITDISPVTLSNYRQPGYETKLALPVAQGIISHDAAFTIRWNWDNVLINSFDGTNIMTVVLNPGPIHSVVVNALIGYHFWHPANFDYVVTANTASVLQVAGSNIYTTQLTVQPYKHTTNINTLGLLFSGSPTAGCIHSNAIHYEINTQVFAVHQMTVREERYESTIVGIDIPDSLITKENYYLGESIGINIRARTMNKVSGWQTLLGGSFTKPSPWKSPVYYEFPTLVQIPDISSVGASVSASATTAGFVVNINGWTLATAFELVWSTDANSTDFTNTRAFRTVSSSRTIDISTTDSAKYYIKVRPLISGQAVADPLSVNVTSGAGGMGVIIYSFGPVRSHLRSYSGTLGGLATGSYGYSWTVSGLASPAGTSYSGVLSDFPTIEGEILTVGNNDYTIDYMIPDWPGNGPAANSLVLLDSTGAQVSTGLAGQAFTIGVSKFARELITWTGPDFDFTITQIEVSQYGRPGYSLYPVAPVVRVYPLAMESDADSVICSTSGQIKYTQPADIFITQINGNRIVRIDAYDPSGVAGANKMGLVADITLTYMKAVTHTNITKDFVS